MRHSGPSLDLAQCQGHHVLAETRTLGDNDKSQAARKARLSQRHVEASFAGDPGILPHVRARRRGLYFGRKDVFFPTETGPMSSQPLAEISARPQIASKACLLGYRARHWLPFYFHRSQVKIRPGPTSSPRHRWSVRSLRSPATCVCPQPSSSVAMPQWT